MKPTFFISLLVALALMLSGCSSTRKTTQAKFEQSITESSSTTATAHNEKSEALLTQSNITENLNAVIDFTRVEFNDGTTLNEILCPFVRDTTKQRDREPTEPPNPVNLNKGIKSITTGRIDLSHKKDENTGSISKSDSKSDKSITAVNDSTAETKSDEQSEEKDKRGWLYYLGEIIGAIITAIVIVFLIRLAEKINWKPK